MVAALCTVSGLGVSALPAEFGPESDWTLYWSDEFDGTALNTSTWTCKTGTHTSQVRLRVVRLCGVVHVIGEGCCLSTTTGCCGEGEGEREACDACV